MLIGHLKKNSKFIYWFSEKILKSVNRLLRKVIKFFTQTHKISHKFRKPEGEKKKIEIYQLIARNVAIFVIQSQDLIVSQEKDPISSQK